MSKIKGIPIGAGFILTEENDYFKIQSVSRNFSMRVNNTLPFYGACKEAMMNIEFRTAFHDMLMFFFFPASIQINQDIYNKYVSFLSGLADSINGIPATDTGHDEALHQVKEEYEMREKLG